LIGKALGKFPLGRPRSGLKAEIKVVFKKTGCEDGS